MLADLGGQVAYLRIQVLKLLHDQANAKKHQPGDHQSHHKILLLEIIIVDSSPPAAPRCRIGRGTC